MLKLPFQNSDPARREFQYLEDMATAYWYSEILFASLELGLFEAIERRGGSLKELANSVKAGEHELPRLLRTLERLELIQHVEGAWFNSQLARRFLVPGSDGYLGDFLLYRRYMGPRWRGLSNRVSAGPPEQENRPCPQDDYEQRTLRYARALDAQARLKAGEIVSMMAREPWEPPVLDIGGGAGALARAFIETKPAGEAVLLELPEVIRAARSLYPQSGYWERLRIVEGDFREIVLDENDRYGLIILSNFLHAYSGQEARSLLQKAAALLREDGVLLIHDYFVDRYGPSPHKGPLYDLNMMLNTYNGECHEARRVAAWLQECGMTRMLIRDLGGDSTIMVGRRDRAAASLDDNPDEWPAVARELGFRQAIPVVPERVITAPWARMKCRCGCSQFGKNLQCPPHGLDHHATRELLDSYKRALLVEGEPPGGEFHEKLLALERRAFLDGYHKAFVMGAGPCPVCPSCPEDGVCRKPDRARPSMEGSGIDVYSTVKNAGAALKPLTAQDQYVKYFGLLLLE